MFSVKHPSVVSLFALSIAQERLFTVSLLHLSASSKEPAWIHLTMDNARAFNRS